MDSEPLSPRLRRLLLECEMARCPLCGRLRGYSVPDDCDELERCPEPWQIEAQLA